MKILIHPTYFASISHYVALSKSDMVIFETEDNFQKQTNRNRTYIYSPNGIQLLNIPVKHSGEAHQKTKDIRIEPDFDWQKQHFKSIEAAYRSSPFFEYFEDEIRPIFEKKHIFLLDLTIETHDFIQKSLRMKLDFSRTTEYVPEVDSKTILDFRHLVNGKKDQSQFESYMQVFGDKHGFLNNLSVLDLLFNEGKYALDYMKNQIL